MTRSLSLGAAAALGTALALTLGVAAPAASAPLPDPPITITAPAEVTVGDPVVVDIAARDVVDLFAFELTLVIDPALVSFDPSSVVGPEGGFTTASIDGDVVTIIHTRLGTSPGLAGDLSLATLTFTALAAGNAPFAVAALTSLDSSAEPTTASDVASASTTVLAPVAEPTPTPPTTPAPTPTASPDLADSGDVSGVGGDPLATTGADRDALIALIALAAALLVAGTAAAIVAVRRRRAVTS